MAVMASRIMAAAMTLSWLGAALASTVAAPAPASARPGNAAARIDRLLADDARRQDQLDPLAALYRGKPVDPAVLALLLTPELDRRQAASAARSLRELARIDVNQLDPARQISYQVFSQAKEDQRKWLAPPLRVLTAVRPINHFGGLQVEFPTLMASDGVLPYDNEAGYHQALLLIRKFPTVLDNAIARFRDGMRSDVVETRMTVRNMIAQIDALLAQPVEESPFYSPVLAFPGEVPEAARPVLQEAYFVTISQSIYPAYRRLRDFLQRDYLPVARETDGLSAMRGGTMLYRQLIERETTLDLDPDWVHRLGLAEVDRIKRAMEGVRQQLGYRGTLRAFFNAIRTDPRFHPRSSKQLADGYAAVSRAVDAQIPRFFSRVPKTPLLIEPYPAYREKFEAGGSYNQGASDASRPGVFFFNTYDLESRFLSGITTLYLHEGAPGHHFQISLAQEDETLPELQRFEGNNAFVEGWALYAETLGYEMGLYKDPLQHWGTLDDEMLRAMRLVVDTGIHARGWTRAQAIAYMLENSGMGATDATAEVERYIANPAQALSYKIGALTIQRLRKKAEGALGPKFDIRAFHDQLLNSGALPLPVLEAKIDRWISER